MRDDLEFRAVTELRSTGRRLAGHAAVFGVTADIGGKFRETIQPGAFTQTLAAGNDILALLDHDPTRLLGRTSSRTLKLAEDARGLAFEIDVPKTQLGDDLLTMVTRGDIGGMSFAFRATAESWPAPDRRSLSAVDLVEVSVVSAWPAYPQTAVALRSRDRLAHPPASPAARARLIGMA
jgi:HK97 family phage prohead protease